MQNKFIGRILWAIGNVIDTMGFRMVMAFKSGILCVAGHKIMKFATKIQIAGCKMWWFNKFMAERQG